MEGVEALDLELCHPRWLGQVRHVVQSNRVWTRTPPPKPFETFYSVLGIGPLEVALCHWLTEQSRLPGSLQPSLK